MVERAIARFIGLLFVSTVLVVLAVLLSYRLSPEHNRRRRILALLGWAFQGLLVPIVIWAVMNYGISWNLQPFMPQIQAAQNSSDPSNPWFREYLRYVGRGVFIVSSYWAVITLAWVIARAAGRLEEEQARSDFKALCISCAIAMLLPGVGIFYLGGLALLGLAAMGVAVPIAAYAPNIIQTKQLPPMYGRAIAKLKFGKYTEAEWEIIRELERCEDDFQGWMMLAELYANNFHDLVEAEQTILDICDQPRTTPSQVSIALHRLADWYLKLGSDPDAARRALQMICDRLKGTHLARMAQLRINQLPRSPQELMERQSATPIPMPALSDDLDEPPPESTVSAARAREMANECVQRLNADPNNVHARERLARILTEMLEKPELGIEQINLLLSMPDQTELKRAEWLGTIAAWHIRYRNDAETGRGFLERVIREFPESPQALVARRRLRLMGASST
jgi:hypothetical protein